MFNNANKKLKSFSWGKWGQDTSARATKMTGAPILTAITGLERPERKGRTSRLVRLTV